MCQRAESIACLDSSKWRERPPEAHCGRSEGANKKERIETADHRGRVQCCQGKKNDGTHAAPFWSSCRFDAQRASWGFSDLVRAPTSPSDCCELTKRHVGRGPELRLLQRRRGPPRAARITPTGHGLRGKTPQARLSHKKQRSRLHHDDELSAGGCTMRRGALSKGGTPKMTETFLKRQLQHPKQLLKSMSCMLERALGGLGEVLARLQRRD